MLFCAMIRKPLLGGPSQWHNERKGCGAEHRTDAPDSPNGQPHSVSQVHTCTLGIFAFMCSCTLFASSWLTVCPVFGKLSQTWTQQVTRLHVSSLCSIRQRRIRQSASKSDEPKRTAQWEEESVIERRTI
jgi:hypothetical protein